MGKRKFGETYKMGLITYKSGQIGQKERLIIKCVVDENIDPYNDFYITKDRMRLYLKDNQDLLFGGLKKGDKIVYQEELGIIFVTGFSDGFDRKYIKILAKDSHSVGKLLKRMLWELKNTDLYIKIKLNNPIKEVLEKNGWKYFGARGKEILLLRTAN